MSVSMPVSWWRTWAALAVGATPNTEATVAAEVSDGGAQHGGLAGAGRADHHDETIGTGDRCSSVALKDVQPIPVHGG